MLIPTGPKFGPGNDISLEELTELCVNQFQQRDRQMWQEYNEKMKNNHGSHLLDRGKRVVLKAIKRDPSRNRKKMDRNEVGQ